MRDVICRYPFLQFHIPNILLIHEDSLNTCRSPGFSARRRNHFLVQRLYKLCNRYPGSIIFENAFNNSSLFRLNYDIVVLILFVAISGTPPGLAGLIAFSNAPFKVFRNTAAFLLRKSCKHGQKHFAHNRRGINRLFLKNHVDSDVFQFSDILQAFNSIAGKSTDALGHDTVDLTVFCVTDHLQKLCAFSYGSARDAFICIHACQDHSRSLVNLFLESLHLRLQAELLAIQRCRYPAIACCPDQSALSGRRRSQFNLLYVFFHVPFLLQVKSRHSRSSFSLLEMLPTLPGQSSSSHQRQILFPQVSENAASICNDCF